MIKSFKDQNTADFFAGKKVKAFEAFERVAQRKLKMLNHAVDLTDLRQPPANRLEALQGDRAGQYSIRINDQWRICFRWQDGAHSVEIVDYH